jgi:EAL domain-containing protein (putative c-di-GMP-specific phosphodiesterase class I)
LRELGVHVGQGYLLSRPLRAEQVTEMLAVTGVELVAA